MNITTFEFPQSINQRLTNIFQSSFEYVRKILYSPYQSTIFILVQNVITFTQTLYYQRNGSNFKILENNLDSICIFEYSPSKFLFYLIIFVCVGLMVLIIFILLVSYLVKKRNKRLNYIQLPNYAENTIQNNFEEILNDKSVPKIKSKHLKLGDTIGMGGQALGFIYIIIYLLFIYIYILFIYLFIIFRLFTYRLFTYYFSLLILSKYLFKSEKRRI